MAHPRRTLDRARHGHYLQLHLPLKISCLTFASSPTCLQQQRACSLGGLFSLRKCPRPRLASHSLPPAHAHFTLLPSCQLNCTRDLLSRILPPTSVSSSFHYSHFLRALRPADHYCNPPSQSAKPTLTQWICSAHTTRKSRLVPVCRPFD